LFFPKMLKQKVYNIADSNIANLGTDLDHKVKQAASQKEHAWDNAGQKVELLIWRIEKFHVVSWPKDKYGTLYSGDAYILLNTYKKKDVDALAWDIHFWLGKYCSQDEAGTAAYKTVELSDRLSASGGHAVQHREVMGSESTLFMGYFKDHLSLLEGGIDSGFKHVEPEKYQPRLLHMKGKKRIRMTQVEMKSSSLNSSDIFILDMGKMIYQFSGAKSSHLERAKAAQFCSGLESERNGLAKVIVIDESNIPDDFWAPLGGKGPIAPTDPNPGPAEPDAAAKSLWKVSDHGDMKFDKVAQGKDVKRTLLSTKEAFVLDTGAEIFAWIGKQAPVEEKKHALQYSQAFITSQKKNPACHCACVIEGSESPHFLGYFH